MFQFVYTINWLTFCILYHFKSNKKIVDQTIITNYKLKLTNYIIIIYSLILTKNIFIILYLSTTNINKSLVIKLYFNINIYNEMDRSTQNLFF
jgi:hypothetical protein